MSTVLAVEGGKPIVRTPIKPRNTVTAEQYMAAEKFLNNAVDGISTLSGYLAGSKRGGGAVQRLEDIWCQTFGVKYAVACNSGTSALLAACAAARVHRQSYVVVPTMGMSAAAAAPRMFGASVRFTDVDEHFHLAPNAVRPSDQIVIAVNLFGRPCRLTELRERCDRQGAYLIEDACQSLWATVDGKLTAGTAHVTCYSMNVHKPLNCGEGGMLVTDNGELAERARDFINHGECTEKYYDLVGLNLRMPELTAVLALSQIESSKRVVERCREIYRQLSRIKDDSSAVSDCYCLPLLAPTIAARDYIVKALNAEGVPCRAGYMLMHRLPAFDKTHMRLPNAEDLESRLILLELCSIDPTNEQVEQMGEAIDTVFKSLW